MQTKNAIAALAALAQDTRLCIFRLLIRVGPLGLAASKIGEELGIAPSSLSFHLKELSRAELISPRPEGRFVIYSANFNTMNDLMAFLSDSCCGGNPCSPVSAVNCVPSPESTAGEALHDA